MLTVHLKRAEPSVLVGLAPTSVRSVVRGLRKVANRPSCGAHPVKFDQEYQVSRSIFWVEVKFTKNPAIARVYQLRS